MTLAKKHVERINKGTKFSVPSMPLNDTTLNKLPGVNLQNYLKQNVYVSLCTLLSYTIVSVLIKSEF